MSFLNTMFKNCFGGSTNHSTEIRERERERERSDQYTYNAIQKKLDHFNGTNSDKNSLESLQEIYHYLHNAEKFISKNSF